MTPTSHPARTGLGLTSGVLSGFAALALIAGCASTPPPNEALAVAEAAVQRASTASTSESAPAALQLAVAKLAASRNALARGDHASARRLAEQATLDAQVAEQKAQAVRARIAATETQAAAEALREELNRKTPR